MLVIEVSLHGSSITLRFSSCGFCTSLRTSLPPSVSGQGRFWLEASNSSSSWLRAAASQRLRPAVSNFDVPRTQDSFLSPPSPLSDPFSDSAKARCKSLMYGGDSSRASWLEVPKSRSWRRKLSNAAFGDSNFEIGSGIAFFGFFGVFFFLGLASAFLTFASVESVLLLFFRVGFFGCVSTLASMGI